MILPPRGARGGRDVRPGTEVGPSARRWLGGINARMAILLAAAAIPVIAIAVANALQDYESALENGRRRAVVAAMVSRAALGGTFLGTETALRALVRLPAASGSDVGACNSLLASFLDIRPQSFQALTLSQDGEVVCTAGRDAPVLPASASAARTGPGLALGTARTSGRGPTVIPATLGFRDSAGTARVVGVGLLPEHFAETLPRPEPGRTDRIWLMDNAGALIPVSVVGDVPVPAADLVSRLRDPGVAVVVDPMRRASMVYASEPLTDGLRVVVGHPYGPVREAAWSALLQRLTELGAFLVVCLAAILIGADLGIVRPLRSLAARVSGWRPGTRFLPARATIEPLEVAELEQAFASASGAIAHREAELRAALVQRDAAMAEIHHRVKNNLQIVSSLLNLQANRIGDAAAQAEFLAARNRVRALATLHRHLYLQQSVAALSLRPFLDELSGQTFQSHGEISGERLALRVETADLSISTDQAVTVALFLTEALGNALEHAFPDGRRGVVTIRVSRENEDAVVAVADDGVGLPENRSPRGLGLGLKLMQGFARQLGGTLRGHDGPGTGWTLRFPLREQDAPPRLPSHPATVAAA